MKWLLVSYSLIILSIVVMHADADDSGEDDCVEQFTVSLEHVTACKVDVHYNETEFIYKLHTILLQYSGDHSAVRVFAEQYCPILDDMLDCLPLLNHVESKCLIPLKVQIEELRYDVAKALVNYVCAENATALLLRIAENGGFKTIYTSIELDPFLNLLTGRNRIDGTTVDTAGEICEEIELGLASYAHVMQNHKNKNLGTIANEIHALYRKAAKC